jgi:hypothetical protein
VKEFTAAFHSEVFRPVVSLVVPGFFATATMSIAAWQRFPIVPLLVDSHPGTAGVFMFLVILTAGLTLEDIGARLERRFDLSLCKVKGYECHMEEWYDYLRLAFEKEPIGHRYLRSMVLRLKFELGMTVASVSFVVGGFAIGTSYGWHLALVVIPLITFFFFLSEAKASNQKLSDVRHELLKKYRDSDQKEASQTTTEAQSITGYEE